jgi:hypothetical protein
MSGMLSRRQPAIVEFEAHCGKGCHKAYLRGRPLQHTLERLDSAGYRCGWQLRQP